MGIVLKGQLYRMNRLPATELRQSTYPDSSIDRHSSFRWDTVDVPTLDVHDSNDIFILPGRKCYFAETDFSWYMESLILRCEDAISGLFSRVGLYVSFGEDICEILLAQYDEDEHLPCVQWDAETHLHTICVI